MDEQELTAESGGIEQPVEEASPEHGVRVASYMGRITLYDPNPGDVSRANRPIVPDALAVKEIEEEIVNAVGALGYAVTVELTRTDNAQ